MNDVHKIHIEYPRGQMTLYLEEFFPAKSKSIRILYDLVINQAYNWEMREEAITQIMSYLDQSIATYSDKDYIRAISRSFLDTKERLATVQASVNSQVGVVDRFKKSYDFQAEVVRQLKKSYDSARQKTIKKSIGEKLQEERKRLRAIGGKLKEEKQKLKDLKAKEKDLRSLANYAKRDIEGRKRLLKRFQSNRDLMVKLLGRM
ncbi:MAG: hypothetical protein ACI4CX_00035 [Candidatus Weimeria sp.]